ncbi:MAG TPA: thioredoxin domain-containing protein [Flavisolibacter sp.]|nr:thioredoxin domain-containing protein [Flavisolibacter sp.]
MKNQKDIPPVIEPKDVFTGNASAPITIMEFGDYESEACAKAHEVVKQLLEVYEGKVKFVFRHFPLTKIHQKAHKAAEAAIAAAQEGKFWDMHSALFANRRNLGVISLKSYAKEIGTTNKRFLDDLINGTYGWNVQGDLMEGLEKGVRDIPTFFINNQKVEGEATFKNLSKAIEETIAEGGWSATSAKRKRA